MRYLTLLGSIRRLPSHCDIFGPLQSCCFRPDFVPADPKAKPKKYKLPAAYDPYGPRPPPSDKIIQLAEKIAALPPEERMQIGPALRKILRHPKMQWVSAEEKVENVEKTTFDIKLEKFDAAARIKVIKEVRALTSLNLKEVKDMVDKVPIVIKNGVSKDEADEIIEKIKAADSEPEVPKRNEVRDEIDKMSKVARNRKARLSEGKSDKLMPTLLTKS